MATAGTIGVNLWCNTAAFAAGIARANASLGGFGQSVGGGVMGIGKFGLGLAGIGGIAATATLAISKVSQALDDIDAKRDLAARLGATVQELRQLEFAAGQSGANMESLTTGLGKMLKTIGEARGGSTEAAASLAALGLSAERLATMSAADAFGEIADRIKDLPTPADRAAAALKIFGKGAAELIPLMLEGKQGIKGMADEFDGLGGVVTGDAADKVDELNDAFGRLKAASGGLWAEIGQGLGTFGKNFSNNLAEDISELRGVFNLMRTGSYMTELPDLIIDTKNPQENPLVRMAREAEALKAVAKEQERLNKLRAEQFSRGASISQSNELPLEAMARKMAELNTLLDVGAIGWGVYQRATEAAKNELQATFDKENQIKGPGKQNAAAVLKGSSAAFTAIAGARSEAKKQEEIAKKSLEVEKKMEAALKSIDANTKSRIVVRPVGIGGP